MNIAAYCRVSTDKSDQLNSLQAQKTFFTEFTERNGHNLVRLYADEGISGTKVRNRREFLQLMQDARSGLFEMVVVKDISRFARNTVDFLQSIRELRALRIETTFLTANMTALGNSEFVLTVFGALAQEESANTSKRIKFGKQINAEKGRVPNLVYGYDKTPGDYFNLTVNEAEAAVVRQIYDWYTRRGCGALRIANMLNESGIKTKRGCQWSQNAVSRILSNELYIGKIINGKQEIADFLTGARAAKDSGEWRVTERPSLALVEPEQFAAARRLAAERGAALMSGGERQTGRHLFSALIRCAECGRAFRRTVRTYRNTYIRWVCSGRNGQGAAFCDNAVEVDEEALLEALDAYFSGLPVETNVIVKAAAGEFARCCMAWQDNARRGKELGDRASRLRRTRKKYLDLYAADLISREEVIAATGGLCEEIERVEQEMRLIGCAAAKNNELEAAVRRALGGAANAVSVREMQNRQLMRIIERIDVDKTGTVCVRLRRFGCGTQGGAAGPPAH